MKSTFYLILFCKRQAGLKVKKQKLMVVHIIH